VLAARSPKRHQALAAAQQARQAHLVPDGTLIPIDPVAADRPFCSGKHHQHGMNLQVITGPAGELIGVSGPLPGQVHDLTAARIWGIIRELGTLRLLTLADKGYAGAGGHPAQAPLLPLASRSARPSHPRTPSARNPRMKKAQCRLTLARGSPESVDTSSWLILPLSRFFAAAM
jgi:DDE superfamily endonuclease